MNMRRLVTVGAIFLLMMSLWAQNGRAQDFQITEFLASNGQVLADSDGDYSDWIEIYNPGPLAGSLAGYYLTDSTNVLAQWKFPAVTMQPNTYLIVFASGKDRAVAGAELHTNFRLSASGGDVVLVKPDGKTIASAFINYPKQQRDVSYGVGQVVMTNRFLTNGASARVVVPTNQNLGFNWIQPVYDDSKWTSANTPVGYETMTPGFAVKNFKANNQIYNLTDAEAVIASPGLQTIVYEENRNVINYRNTEWGAHYGNDYTYPGFVMGADIDSFVIEAIATLSIPEAGTYTFGVNSDDGFLLTIGGFSMSYPSGRGPTDSLGTVTFPYATNVSLRLVAFEMWGGSEVEFFAAKGAFTAWNSTNFHLVGDIANGGLAVTAPILGTGSTTGYKPRIKTDVQKIMAGKNATLYMRSPFVMTNTSSLGGATLRMAYDDGFIVYINGQEVARRNAPTSPQWKSTATNTHGLPGSLSFEEIDLTSKLSVLRNGTNMMAIQGLNISSNDPTFYLSAELVEYRVLGTTNHYFGVASPGKPNSAGFFAFAADTKFSVDRGFYDAPVMVEITCATTNATIRYTTNGSVPTLSNGFTYKSPLRIASTTTLRAAAYQEGYEPSKVDTHTYVFVSDVIRQCPTGQAPSGWPSSWGANTVDYGMDPEVVNNPRYSGTIKNDLKSIPTFSIVMDQADLFDPGKGIYANAGQDGSDWERPCSVELINPDGSEGFQINAGVRIRGGYSRSADNPKHAFRLFFRQEYGAGKLVFPLFGKEGTDTFDCIDLRTMQNYSWSYGGDSRGIFIRDQWNRDTQLEMGQAGERGYFYHLYINGLYWGLYNTCERPEASYAETYLGGQKENYDVIKVEAGVYRNNATDGTMDAWVRLYNACTNGIVFTNLANYMKIQGRNVDGSRNPAYENLVDVTNLVDYMLIILYGGNLDAPISWFLNNERPNNWYGLRDRTGADGFRFIIHDAEHTLLDLNEDRTGPFPAGTNDVYYSSPQWVWQQLWNSPEFRLTIADRIQKHMFNDGVLTPDKCIERFLRRKTEIDRAVVGESARWGDSKRTTPLTRDVEWIAAINNVLTNILPYRTGVVLQQLRDKNLFPNLQAPSFGQHGGHVEKGFNLSMEAFGGTIYYTTNGTDPRVLGGAISAQAQVYRGPITIGRNQHVMARTWNGLEWSPLTEADFLVIQTFKELVITEIMYHPQDQGQADGDRFEFLELKNIGTDILDLSGVHFTSGIDFTFTNGTVLAPGQFAVLVHDPASFQSNYPSIKVDGVYAGQLANNGDELTLVHAIGTPLFSVKYDSRAPWPATADGMGFSIVPMNPNANSDPDNAAHWRASAFRGGSPGADDPEPLTGTVLINEFLSNSEPPEVDAIELHNPTDFNINIGYWYLTDDKKTPKKYRIPAGRTVQAGGYVVLTESDFNPTPGIDPSFTLSSHGEQVYLFAANAAGELTGYCDGVEFDAAATGVTFGRYTNSLGEVFFPAQRTNTLGRVNSGPRVGPIVINEIYYHPATGQTEFVEFKNISTNVVKLYDARFSTNTWRLKGGGYAFPPNVEIPANGLFLVVAGDTNSFRTQYKVPSSVPVFGPMSGVLQDSGELLQLQQPEAPELDTNGTVYVPYVTVDEVRYNDKYPWPTNADGGGASLERLIASGFGNDALNWRDSDPAPSPGVESNRKPYVYAGQDANLLVTALPIVLQLTGTAVDDGMPVPPGTLYTYWGQSAGPALVEFSTTTELATKVTITEPGPYVLRLTAEDGEHSVYHEVSINVVMDSALVWKQRYFTEAEIANPAIGGDNADPDQDGASNLQEYGAGTDPRNSKSFLKLNLKNGSVGGPKLSFAFVAGHSYSIMYRDSLATGGWQKLTDVAADSTSRIIEVEDPLPHTTPVRFYRLVTPALP